MPLTTQPLAESRELDSVREDLYTNVPFPERIGSIAAGAALVGLALWRRSWPGLLLAAGGAALIHRGATGHCQLYEKLGISSRQLNTERGVPGKKGIQVSEEIWAAGPRAKIYRFGRNLKTRAGLRKKVKRGEKTDAAR